MKKRRVLVIDDHLPSRAFLVKALNEKGFGVVGEGASGKGALRLTQSTAPDAVLMSVGLPDIDGISAAETIMEENPLPIVLLTSHYDAETIERAKEAGVMAYLLKPLREEELLPATELAISRFEEFNSLRKENEDLKKTLEARKAIERAKGVLMKQQGLSEPEAFSLIQRKSMDLRKPMTEIAQAIILAEEITKEKSS
jgi:AmiR/NasT family two-component response regulator